MALGPRDTLSLVMLTGWDATALQNFKLQDGTTFETVATQMNAALGALGSEIYSHPLYSSLVSYTDEPDLEYRTGASNGMGRHSEYGRPDMQRAATEGHMLPLLDWDRALGWTWDYLRRSRMSQIEADIADAVKDVRDRYRVQILTRCLQRGDDSGTNKGLGSSGLSPGFATTAASTGVDFVPPAHGGTTFASTHEHYVGITGGAHTAAVFTDAQEELREHGHEPPYEYITGTTEEAAIKALTGFVAADEAWVSYGALQDRANFAQIEVTQGMYPIGALNNFRIWIVRGMPQYYGFAWKPYGPNSQRNPLRIRLQKGVTRPMVTAYPDNSLPGPAQPLKGLYLFTEFGVGVADRTNGTARYTNSATWADGTPT
jgi:hypothetical protein